MKRNLLLLPLITAILLLTLISASGCSDRNNSAGSPKPAPSQAARPSEPSPSPTDVPYFPPSGSGPREFFVSVEGRDSNPGTIDKPWATISHAARALQAGDTLFIRGGTYKINAPIDPVFSGKKDAVITYTGYRDEKVVIDASDYTPSKTMAEFSIDYGAFMLRDDQYIKVKNIKVMNSYCKGIYVYNSSNIDIISCTTENTFACGIAMWDTTSEAKFCNNNRILGNTVINANTWDMLPEGMKREGEPPHEAISIAGASAFEVAYNHVYDCDKEGIDVKEVSRNGKVHHNYIHNVERQGLYADSWFGKLMDVEFYNNIVEECRGAGVAVSVEGGSLLDNVSIHNNLIVNNYGTGIFFSRGDDGPRTNVSIYNNTLVHNGYGYPDQQDFFWITGGIYLFSPNLENVKIYNNILSDNKAFEIGWSDLYTKDLGSIDSVFAEKKIDIAYNLIDDRNKYKYPVYVGWTDNYANVYPYTGRNTKKGSPRFVNPAAGDYRPAAGSPAVNAGSPDKAYNDADGSRNDIGAFSKDQEADFWWMQNFPPMIE